MAAARRTTLLLLSWALCAAMEGRFEASAGAGSMGQPAMRAAQQGRIINISSVHGRVGAARMAAYCATKFGLIGFTQALAEEVKDEGIVVTALCPASVDTRILRGSGLAPEVTPEEVAEAIFFLAKAPAAVAGTAMDMFG